MSKQPALMTKAFRLYRAYKTTTPEYRAIAAQLGYTPLDLNAVMNARLNSSR